MSQCSLHARNYRQQIYTGVKSVVDYAVRVFQNALPQFLINELVRLEERVISIIMPGTSYNNACQILGIIPMVDYVDSLCDKLFHSIAFDKDHTLNSLLPPLYKIPRYNLRNHRLYNMPHVCANWPKNLLYLQWPPRKLNFIGNFLSVELVTIIVGCFPNYISQL